MSRPGLARSVFLLRLLVCMALLGLTVGSPASADDVDAWVAAMLGDTPVLAGLEDLTDSIGGRVSFSPRVTSLAFSAGTPEGGLTAPLLDGGKGSDADFARLGTPLTLDLRLDIETGGPLSRRTT